MSRNLTQRYTMREFGSSNRFLLGRDYYATLRERICFDRVPPEPTLSAIITKDNLVKVFKMRSRTSAGPDGLAWSDYSITEFGDVADLYVDLIRNQGIPGHFQPAAPKIVYIPKPDGGSRELAIRTIPERVIAAAVGEAITPLFEEIFLPCSFGFRAGRSCQHILALVQHLIEEHGYSAIGKDDIRNAFGAVPIYRVADQLRSYIEDDGLWHLINSILRGHNQRDIGIDQGDPISPTILNVDLHHILDRHSIENRGENIPFRYVDDLVVLARSVSEGSNYLQEVVCPALSHGGYELHDRGEQVVNLNRRGSSIELLGVSLSLINGTVCFEPTSQAINKLRTGLQQASLKQHPVASARQALSGWINAKGAVFENCRADRHYGRISHVLRECGFYELISTRLIGDMAEQALSQWNSTRESSVSGYLDTLLTSTGDAHAPQCAPAL